MRKSNETYEQVLIMSIRDIASALVEGTHDKPPQQRDSDYFSLQTGERYERLSKLFSRRCGMTIKDYLIGLKMERAKRLIAEGSINLTRIAATLGYCHVQYLSRQFHAETGTTMSEFQRQLQRAGGMEEAVYSHC